MEFTLPIFLKLFPNMLPSTFKEADKEVIDLVFSLSFVFQRFVFLLARCIEKTIKSEIRSGEIFTRYFRRYGVKIEKETF